MSFSFKWDSFSGGWFSYNRVAKDGPGSESCACPLMWSSTFPAGLVNKDEGRDVGECLGYKLWVRGVFSAVAVAAENVCGMRRMSSALTSFGPQHGLDSAEIKGIGWDLIWR